jgi:arylsulfatase A-like enzyme
MRMLLAFQAAVAVLATSAVPLDHRSGFHEVHEASTRPNIVFFFTDDEDAALMNIGHGIDVLPTVRDQIFNAGINLTAGSFVSSPICCPSRGSLFSGRYSHNIGGPTMGWCGNFSAVREDTMLTALSNAGYVIGQVRRVTDSGLAYLLGCRAF